MGRIPVPEKTPSKSIPKLKKIPQTHEGIVFSFEALEKTEYFNLDGTCQNWASDMLDMCKEVSKLTVKQLTSGEFRTFRFHSHEEVKKCPSALPDGVELKDMYQLRISTSKGGIHGVLRENCFYVIWLDPLHNMYPDDRFGGLRKVKEASTCCKDRDEEIIRIQEELKKAQVEAEEWQKFAQDIIDNHGAD